MSWDWGSPIALGLFILMMSVTIMFLGLAATLAASSAKWNIAANTRRRGRR